MHITLLQRRVPVEEGGSRLFLVLNEDGGYEIG